MLDNNFADNTSDIYSTGGGAVDQGLLAADLSRVAWDCFPRTATQPKSENQILTDQQGRIAQVNTADGTTYEYGNFQANGQPGLIKIIDKNTGNYGQWKREEDGLWRSYSKDKPNHEVVRGEWVVDGKGMMHMQGVQDSTELPPQIVRDVQGHITKLTQEDGVVYQYSKFDSSGQPTVCKITDSKTHDWGYWKKEGDHLWRSYDKEKPNYEILRGDWTVDEHGRMRMDGVQDTMDIPRARPASERPQVALSSGRKIGPGPDGLPGAPPAGCRNLQGPVTPAIAAEAKSLLGGEFGTETPFEIDGKRYVARVEPHYHPPGYKGGPNGWHKGVTVYEIKN